MASSTAIAALSAVLAHEEAPAVAELRAALAEARRTAAAQAAKMAAGHAAEIEVWRLRYEALLQVAVERKARAREVSERR
jgi:hypothetical protein